MTQPTELMDIDTVAWLTSRWLMVGSWHWEMESTRARKIIHMYI